MESAIDSLKSAYESVPQWACLVVGGVFVAVPSIYYIFGRKSRKYPIKDDWKPGVVYLYQLPRINYLPSLSPYCLKVETWLRMADINYENVPVDYTNIPSKEGYVPFIELNGVEYDDSTLILDVLPSKLSGKGTDTHLDQAQLSTATAFEIMIANCTVYSYAYFRHMNNVGQVMTERILGTNKVPLLLKIIPNCVIIRKMKKKLIGQGMGRHSPGEIERIGERDLMAINNFLGDKEFFMGSKPSRVDAAVFSILAMIIYLPFDTPHTTFVMQNCPKLVEYTDRMKRTFWPDWDEIIKTKKMDTKWKQ